MIASNFQMKKLDELAHLLANPVLPKASRLWSGADVVIASAPQPDDLRRSSNPKDREVLTEHRHAKLTHDFRRRRRITSMTSGRLLHARRRLHCYSGEGKFKAPGVTCTKLGDLENKEWFVALNLETQLTNCTLIRRPAIMCTLRDSPGRSNFQPIENCVSKGKGSPVS